MGKSGTPNEARGPSEDLVRRGLDAHRHRQHLGSADGVNSWFITRASERARWDEEGQVVSCLKTGHILCCHRPLTSPGNRWRLRPVPFAGRGQPPTGRIVGTMSEVQRHYTCPVCELQFVVAFDAEEPLGPTSIRVPCPREPGRRGGAASKEAECKGVITTRLPKDYRVLLPGQRRTPETMKSYKPH